jgi:hypothetical protein
MPGINRCLFIQAERDALFDMSLHYGRRHLCDTFLREARLLDGAMHAAVGARAWCVAWHGLGIETVYVTVPPPGVVAANMTRGPVILAPFAASWRFAEERPAVTRVTLHYHFKARPRLLRGLIEPVPGVLFSRDAGCRCAGCGRRRRLAACMTEAGDGKRWPADRDRSGWFRPLTAKGKRRPFSLHPCRCGVTFLYARLSGLRKDEVACTWSDSLPAPASQPPRLSELPTPRPKDR